MTPVTPIMIQAPSTTSLQEAGYIVAISVTDPTELGISDDCGDNEIAKWEPDKPAGYGWVLHHKGWMEDATIGAIWARQDVVIN